jgi:hypothetical protein
METCEPRRQSIAMLRDMGGNMFEILRDTAAKCLVVIPATDEQPPSQRSHPCRMVRLVSIPCSGGQRHGIKPQRDRTERDRWQPHVIGRKCSGHPVQTEENTRLSQLGVCLILNPLIALKTSAQQAGRSPLAAVIVGLGTPQRAIPVAPAGTS